MMDLAVGAVLHLLSLVNTMDLDEGCETIVDQHDPLSLDQSYNFSLVHKFNVPQQPWPVGHLFFAD